jgi:hypothetical protein
MHVYEVRPRKDKRGVDLISDALPFGPPVVRRAECGQQCNRLRQVSQPLDRFTAVFGELRTNLAIAEATELSAKISIKS